MHENERLNDHQKFKELAALAGGRGLTVSEQIELKRHLQLCEACREIYREYSLLSSEGMAFLAADYGHVSEAEAWDYRAARDQLSSRIRESEHSAIASAEIASAEVDRPRPARVFGAWIARARWAATAAVACLLVGMGAYHLGSRRPAGLARPSAVVSPALTPLQQLASEKKTADDLLLAQMAQISRLQKQISGEQRDLTGLRAALHAAENHSSELSTANSKGETQFRQVSEERDKLAAQLRDAEKAYQNLQLEFTSLRAEHDRGLLHTAYIADVFDVDSGSRTRKPFGRVFYTQNKSLIFYAFDLDRQPGVKNASAFQVWGQRDGELSAKSHPMNLGILYMDSDSNRRWVLRWDDPKQLAEIDAVFVTVEPHGGSQKPTGKPFLYALLRKEANHP